MSDMNMVTGDSVMLSWYIKFVSAVCEPDMDIIKANMNASVNTWLFSERIVSFDNIYFIANHMGSFIMSLVLNYNDARNITFSALKTELNITRMDFEDHKKLRVEMQKDIKIDRHYIELGLTMPTYSMFSSFWSVCSNNLSACDSSKYAAQFEYKVITMSNNDKIILSVILSDYIYLIRAFCNNSIFHNQIISILTDFEKQF